FRALGDEITDVLVEGTRLTALVSTLDGIRNAGKPDSVRLLPNFDPYTLCIPRKTTPYLLDPAFYERVFRVAGWISPVVLVNGHIAGVWEYDRGKSKTTVKVEAFEPLSKKIQKAVVQEADRLEAFYNQHVEVEFTSTP